jgi:hypothetical protein
MPCELGKFGLMNSAMPQLVNKILMHFKEILDIEKFVVTCLYSHIQTLIDFQIACENKLQIGQVFMPFSYLKTYYSLFAIMVSTYYCVQMFIICMDNHCVQIKPIIHTLRIT